MTTRPNPSRHRNRKPWVAAVHLRTHKARLFPSALAAARALADGGELQNGDASEAGVAANISAALSGRIASAFGYTWAWLDPSGGIDAANVEAAVAVGITRAKLLYFPWGRLEEKAAGKVAEILRSDAPSLWAAAHPPERGRYKHKGGM